MHTFRRQAAAVGEGVTQGVAHGACQSLVLLLESVVEGLLIAGELLAHLLHAPGEGLQGGDQFREHL